jgi:predicted lipoprotein
VDKWPVDPDKDDALMTGDEPLDDAVVNTGANGRGLPALELLLWDPAIEDVGSPDADRRHALVRALAADVARQAAAIRDVWAPDGEAYATAIAEAGTGSAAYPTAKSAVDVLVNQLLFTTELVLDQKLGRPAGKRTGTPRPEEVEAGRSGRSLAAIGANLDGLEGVYFAMRGDAQGVGLSALIARRSAPADARTRAALAEARALVTAIPEPLDRAVVDDPAAVDAAYQSLRALRQLMATEIVAVLGATLTFNDNDGD